jgi:ribosome-binding protein aMBF1 (putative translation factor)
MMMPTAGPRGFFRELEDMLRIALLGPIQEAAQYRAEKPDEKGRKASLTTPMHSK